MKKLILTTATILTLAGGYAFFAAPCCGTTDSCEASSCCADKPDCCDKTSTASLGSN